MKRTVSGILVAAAVSTTLCADALMDKAKNSGLMPIPASQSELLKLTDNPKNPITDAKVELGKKLFFDPRLSKSGLISCNTCHNLATGGADNVPAAIGHGWAMNAHHLNSPTVYNAVFAQSQFWDGRDPHLEAQAQGPMQSAVEMSATKDHVANVVKSMPEYVRAFKMAYSDPNVKITFPLVADTIAIYERTLVTPSRYDKYIAGCEKALSDKEKEGLNLFIDKGCATCHSGVALGGMMMPFPQVNPYKYANIGDFKGDANGMVKVPTLRNVTQTAPYFHNGAVWSLKEAIQIMGETQLGIQISHAEAAKIETFLAALEGEKPEVIFPMLPKSTKNTPRPNVK